LPTSPKTDRPDTFAEFLQDAGLRRVGVLKIQGSNVGCGDYVEQLKEALTRRGIEVGYISAYKGYVTFTGVAFQFKGETHAVNLAWLGGKTVNVVVPSYLMQKVVKGNIDIAFPRTRYDMPGQDY
jgi:hypothetical protein